MRTGTALAAVAATAVVSIAATGWAVSSSHGGQPTQASLPPQGSMALASVPLGDVAGAAQAGSVLDTANPLGNDPRAVAEGHRLFMAMNCAGCHGYNGGGGMGPKLTDSYWRYGGAPAQIYNTLVQGRPQGMPSWGKVLPPVKLWELTAYVSSLGGGVPAASGQAGMQGDYSGRSDQTAQPNAAEGGFAIEGQ